MARWSRWRRGRGRLRRWNGLRSGPGGTGGYLRGPEGWGCSQGVGAPARAEEAAGRGRGGWERLTWQRMEAGATGSDDTLGGLLDWAVAVRQGAGSRETDMAAAMAAAALMLASAASATLTGAQVCHGQALDWLVGRLAGLDPGQLMEWQLGSCSCHLAGIKPSAIPAAIMKPGCPPVNST